MIHRFPLWALGPLFLLGAAVGTEYRPACLVIGIVLSAIFTVPAARRELAWWREDREDQRRRRR